MTARELAHPLPAAALAMLAVNDHILKGAELLPAWITGKLSDFAGLFLCPIVLFVLCDAVARIFARELPRRAAATACGVAPTLVFAALKLDPSLNAAANAHWGAIALDSSDLIACPMGLASAAWLGARASASRFSFARPEARYALLIAASIACIATAPTRTIRNYPAWELIHPDRYDLGCAQLLPWVSKSGKQGVGITLLLEARGADRCEVAVQRASFAVGDQIVAALTLPPVTLLDATPSYLYLPFAFDNEASWNRGELHASLVIELAVNGQAMRLSRQRVRSSAIARVLRDPCSCTFADRSTGSPRGPNGGSRSR